MRAPEITSSTEEERRQYIKNVRYARTEAEAEKLECSSSAGYDLSKKDI